MTFPCQQREPRTKDQQLLVVWIAWKRVDPMVPSQTCMVGTKKLDTVSKMYIHHLWWALDGVITAKPKLPRCLNLIAHAEVEHMSHMSGWRPPYQVCQPRFQVFEFSLQTITICWPWRVLRQEVVMEVDCIICRQISRTTKGFFSLLQNLRSSHHGRRYWAGNRPERMKNLCQLKYLYFATCFCHRDSYFVF